MHEFDGLYRHKKTKELVVIKVADLSRNRLIMLPLKEFVFNVRSFWRPLDLSYVSKEYERTPLDKKLEALYNIKERMYNDKSYHL